MEAELQVMKTNLNVWKWKVLKLKEQEEITKNYLATNINNLRITNEIQQKMEGFMADAHADPKFINQIMVQLQNEQEMSNRSVCTGGSIQSSLPFIMPNLKVVSRNPNPSFPYKLFDMVNDPNTNSIVLWSQSGTSFFIKDTEGLHGHVQEIFNHTIETFYKTLSDFGFQCVDKFLREYTNENFQRDNKHMLKKMKSKRKLLAAKKNLQSGMEEELKRLGFFQNALKASILRIKEKEQATRSDLGHVKMCLLSASKRVAQEAKGQRKVGLPPVESQPQAYGKRRLKQDRSKLSIQRNIQKFADRKDERRPWLDHLKVGVNAEIGKLKHELDILNVQILNLEQGQAFIENQLAAIEGILPNIERKQQDIELSVNKLFKKPHATPKRWSREQGKKKKVEGVIKKPQGPCSENLKQVMNANDHKTSQEDLTSNLESNRLAHDPKESDNSAPDSDYENLMLWIGISEGELTFS